MEDGTAVSFPWYLAHMYAGAVQEGTRTAEDSSTKEMVALSSSSARMSAKSAQSSSEIAMMAAASMALHAAASCKV